MHVPRPVATAALHAVLCLASAFAFPPPLTAQTRFAADSLREDLRVLREALFEAHAGLSVYTSPAALGRSFDR